MKEYCHACTGTGQIATRGTIISPGVRDLVYRTRQCDVCNGTGVVSVPSMAEFVEEDWPMPNDDAAWRPAVDDDSAPFAPDEPEYTPDILAQLTTALADLATAHDEITRLRGLLSGFIDADADAVERVANFYEDMRHCSLCGMDEPAHTADCIVTRARSVLAAGKE